MEQTGSENMSRTMSWVAWGELGKKPHSWRLKLSLYPPRAFQCRGNAPLHHCTTQLRNTHGTCRQQRERQKVAPRATAVGSRPWTKFSSILITTCPPSGFLSIHDQVPLRSKGSLIPDCGFVLSLSFRSLGSQEAKDQAVKPDPTL